MSNNNNTASTTTAAAAATTATATTPIQGSKMDFASTKDCVAVGLDIGPLFARVAILSGKMTEDNDPKMVSNTLGHWETLCLSVVEEDVDYYDNDQQQQQQKEQAFCFGDAAQRFLQSRKKDFQSHTLMNVLQQQEETKDDCNDDNNNKNVAEGAFLAHLAQLACDATSRPLWKLRLVLSVPYGTDPGYAKALLHAAQEGIRRDAIRAANATFADDKNTAKALRKFISSTPLVVGLLSNPAAMLVAHKLDKKDEQQQQQQHNCILMVDWNDKGLSLSLLSALGSSRMYRVTHHRLLTEWSRMAMVRIMVSQVATTFARTHRLCAQDVQDHFKARSKLTMACLSALPSLQQNNTTVTLDGLYDGLDCHVPISKPRWDMWMAPIFRGAKQAVQDFLKHATANHEQPTLVLQAGSVCQMQAATTMLKELFPNNELLLNSTNNNNNNKNILSSEEVIAKGCARQAAACLMLSSLEEETPCVHHHTPRLASVPTSPISLVVAVKDTRCEVLKKGTPLPALVTHTITMQNDDDDDDDDENVLLCQDTKVLARIPTTTTTATMELTIGLSVSGKLKLSVNGSSNIIEI